MFPWQIWISGILRYFIKNSLGCMQTRQCQLNQMTRDLSKLSKFSFVVRYRQHQGFLTIALKRRHGKIGV